MAGHRSPAGCRGMPASKPVALLLAGLGVAKSYLPVPGSSDNPYNLALFRTVKYCPAFPKTSASLGTPAGSVPRSSTRRTSIIVLQCLGLLTPNVVHTGQAQAVPSLHAPSS